jgi:hypothetical protein
MSRNVDLTHDASIAAEIALVLEDLGYTAEESLGGLVRAVQIVAESTADAQEALDEFVEALDRDEEA